MSEALQDRPQGASSISEPFTAFCISPAVATESPAKLQKSRKET